MKNRIWIGVFLTVVFVICMTGAFFFFRRHCLAVQGNEDNEGALIHQISEAQGTDREILQETGESEETIEIPDAADTSAVSDISEKVIPLEADIEAGAAPQTGDVQYIVKIVVYEAALITSWSVFLYLMRRKIDDRKCRSSKTKL